MITTLSRLFAREARVPGRGRSCGSWFVGSGSHSGRPLHRLRRSALGWIAALLPIAAAGQPNFEQSIVRLHSRLPDEARSAQTLGTQRVGSGVVLGPRLVLTIGYLVLEADEVEVMTASGRRIPASVAGFDHATGFGLVRPAVALDAPALELGDSDGVQEQQSVLTQGQGEAFATELTVVSRDPFAGNWEYLLERPILTVPAVNNWSGSALIDHDGRLVGIGSLVVHHASDDPSAIPGNLFVPVNLLKPILTELIEHGRRAPPVQPWLGLSTQRVRNRLVVQGVVPNGPAQLAGIQRGDIVLAVEDQSVSDQAAFYRQLWSLGPAGTLVHLRILHEGEPREVTVRSMDRSDSLHRPRGI